METKIETEVAMQTLRQIFPEGKADHMNFVLFSTSGVHGTYMTIEDAEVSDDPEITFLVIQPRVVFTMYGTVKPTRPEDFAFLKQLRATSHAVLAEIGLPRNKPQPAPLTPVPPKHVQQLGNTLFVIHLPASEHEQHFPIPFGLDFEIEYHPSTIVVEKLKTIPDSSSFRHTQNPWPGEQVVDTMQLIGAVDFYQHFHSEGRTTEIDVTMNDAYQSYKLLIDFNAGFFRVIPSQQNRDIEGVRYKFRLGFSAKDTGKQPEEFEMMMKL